MKFVILEKVTKDTRARIENKVVCDVIEHTFSTPIGTFKGWRGSVEEAYFSVTFVKGVISLSMSEREMCVGWELISYAIIESVNEIITKKVYR